jgi:transposase
MNQGLEIEVKNLDHLGLIAGIIDEMGVVEQVNKIVGEQPGEIVSPGHVVKAIILNGLGFVTAPLYLFRRFFEGKATEHLIGEGIKPEHLNDDRIGRIMDKLYQSGLSQIFTVIALEAVKKYEVKIQRNHLESSSFHVHGKYENQLPKLAFTKGEMKWDDPKWSDIEEREVPHPIEITYGYSRDHRPDLKQFIVDLICSGDGDIPLFIEVGNGNESDKATFGKICRQFREQLKMETLMVADSALYSAPNLKLMEEMKWLCRVPLTIKEAKSSVNEIPEEQLESSKVKGYRLAEKESNYAGIAQRWLVVESEARRASDLKKLEKFVSKSEKEAMSKFKKLCQEKLTSPQAAIEAAERLNQKLKYHKLLNIEGVELLDKLKNKAKETDNINYKIQAELVIDQSVIAEETRRAGRFVLATNVLDRQGLSPDEMLSEYKSQQSTERGFGFLKDPLFFTDSVFIKSPERVEAMAMLMGLCLLVYTLGQRQLRQALKLAQSGIKNQLGKLTERPTLRWIFQCFQSVHFLIVNGTIQVANLTPERLQILKFFPQACRRYYLV